MCACHPVSAGAKRSLAAGEAAEALDEVQRPVRLLRAPGQAPLMAVLQVVQVPLAGEAYHAAGKDAPLDLAELSMPQLTETRELLVQTLVDQGELKGWKTRGGHRRISLDSIQDYQSASRSSMGMSLKSSVKPRVTVVVESAQLMDQLMAANSGWTIPVEVTFFDSVTEALLELSSKRPDMLVVEMSMPRAQQEKTLQALENFNSRGRSPLSVVLITKEKDLLSSWS
mgnify:CR=1 FL=1